MEKTVLLVDDDPMILAALKNTLKKYEDDFSVFVADDGLSAVDIIKEKPVSLVVTDLKMPRMDGLSLLSYILENKPSTPCIVMTAYSTKELEASAKEGGALGYIEKPLNYSKLEKQILAALQQEPDGGILRGVSLGIFLQLVEMEKKTCTIRVTSGNSSSHQGTLFFSEGILLDAECLDQTGEKAAYTILSWDNVDVAILNSCHLKTQKIETSLQMIIFDATRAKDEKESEEELEDVEELDIEEMEIEELEEIEDLVEEVTLFQQIEASLGNKKGVDKIYSDPSWKDMVDLANNMGHFFKTGDLKLCYLSGQMDSDFILVPGKEIVTVSLSKKTIKDDVVKDILKIISN